MGSINKYNLDGSKGIIDMEKMVSVEKVQEWLLDNFSEWERDGDYDYGQPYIECAFDTFEEMMKSFDKLIEE